MRQMTTPPIRRTGGNLADRRPEPGGAVARHDDGIHARGFSRTQAGAQVVGILHTVQYQHQRILPEPIQKTIQVPLREAVGGFELGHDILVALSLGSPIELSPGLGLHRNTLPPSPLDQRLDARIAAFSRDAYRPELCRQPLQCAVDGVHADQQAEPALDGFVRRGLAPAVHRASSKSILRSCTLTAMTLTSTFWASWKTLPVRSPVSRWTTGSKW